MATSRKEPSKRGNASSKVSVAWSFWSQELPSEVYRLCLSFSHADECTTAQTGNYLNDGVLLLNRVGFGRLEGEGLIGPVKLASVQEFRWGFNAGIPGAWRVFSGLIDADLPRNALWPVGDI